jgi:tetratricopeptide (TPR) repeat protein
MTAPASNPPHRRRVNRWLIVVVLAILVCGTTWFLYGQFSPDGKKSRLISRAEAYFKQGDYDKARIEYLNLLRLEPKHSLAIQRLGVIWFENGAVLQAFPYLRAARELAPENLEVAIKYASALIVAGRTTDARKELTSILRRNPQHGDALLLLIEIATTDADIADAEQLLKNLTGPKTAPSVLAAALLSVKRKDIPGAEAAIREALALDPNSFSAHLALASIHAARNENPQVVEQIKIAASLAPIRSNARIKYAETRVQAGAPEDARKLVGEITAKAPDYIPAWIFLAQLALTEKKHDEVATLLQNVFSRDPINYEAGLINAQAALGKGEAQKAVAMLEQLIKTFPAAGAAKLTLARAYLGADNTAKAAEELRQLLTADPNNASATLLLAEINIRTGNAASSIPGLLDLLKKQPRLSPAKLLLAEAYRATGKLDQAVEVFREEVRTAPTSGGYFFLGKLLSQQGKFPEAQAALEKAVELTPDNLLAINQLVELDLRQKNFTSARDRVQQLLAKQPRSADAKFIEGKVLTAQRDFDGAEKSLLAALEFDPNLSSAYALLISNYIENNRLEPARVQLEAMLTKNPSHVHARALLGIASEKLKDFQRAQQAYEKILETDPKFVPALNNLACLYADHLGQLDKALDLARQARTHRPSDPSVADTLGWILHRRGDYQEALGLIKEAADKLTESAEVKYHLGMTHYMMGNSDAARTALREAAAGKDDFPGKAGIAARLKLLGDTPASAQSLPVAELEAMVKEQPTDPNLRTLIAEAYEKQQDVPKAIAACEEALRLNSKLVAPTVALARLHLATKNSAKALEFAKKARALAQTDAKVGGALGRIALQAGDHAWSHSLLQEAAQKSPGDVEITHDLAWAAYSLGKTSQARTLMQQLAQQPLDPPRLKEVQTFLAMDTLLQQPPADPAAAAAQAQAILAVNPDDVPALMVRAAAEAARGERPAAVATCQKVLAKYPAFAPAQKQLAAVYLDDPATRAKAYDLAISARRELPDDTALAQVLAEAACERGEFRFALQVLNETAAKGALHARGRYHLGVCHMQLGDKPKALAAIKDAVAAGLAEPFATDAKARITALEK